MLHSTASSLLAIYALSADHSLAGDFVNEASYPEFVTTAISTGRLGDLRSGQVYRHGLITLLLLGYFAYDLWDYVLNRLYIKSPGIVVHHVVILICYIAALTKTVGVPLLCFALMCELHSAFMHLRKLMVMSSYSPKASAFFRWVWAAQWATFLLARFIPHTIITVLTFQARQLFANAVRPMPF